MYSGGKSFYCLPTFIFFQCFDIFFVDLINNAINILPFLWNYVCFPRFIFLGWFVQNNIIVGQNGSHEPFCQIDLRYLLLVTLVLILSHFSPFFFVLRHDLLICALPCQLTTDCPCKPGIILNKIILLSICQDVPSFD